MEQSHNKEAKSISVLLFDAWSNHTQDIFTIDVNFKLYDDEKRLKILLDILNVLDPQDKIRHILLDYGDEGYEEFDSRLSAVLNSGRLDTTESLRLRMLVLNSVALGTTFVIKVN